ncbi:MULTISPECIES: hypothetical protein [Aerococcus]|uniref:Uncharacterized protein n=1 Tax=Aerococcus mictus TaxID=2976810 RepID=A0A9Q4H5K1_9LACT|nr:MULTISPECIES: hypothetical protein [Aerococcus]MCY3031632.1 hypothetical protein [Aerococcus sp. Group 1]MCY3039760.1 hypothetical protein [Aerococcus sp. Group 2]MCY3041568.1 hypothetical protein [Aerococcus sp. Group 2]MCY3043213.1 hypothetical protein [Aerococcus sp. Group 2]MCY3066252.1 hypothetical protein [Aerococcus mictus]
MKLTNTLHLVEHYNRLYGFDLLDAYDHCVLVLTKFALLNRVQNQEPCQVKLALADAYMACVMMADSYARCANLRPDSWDQLPSLDQAFTSLALDVSVDRDLGPAISDLVAHLWGIGEDLGYDLGQCLIERVAGLLDQEEMGYASMA